MALNLWLVKQGIEQFQDTLIDIGESNGDIGKAESMQVNAVIVMGNGDDMAFMFVWPDYIGITSWDNDVEARVYRNVSDAVAYFRAICPKNGYKFTVHQDGSGEPFTFSTLAYYADIYQQHANALHDVDVLFGLASGGEYLTEI